ncbi:putative ABC-type multidrug transport system ATPase component [Klebsiella pneumoniae]|nr:putative ABC-type multidrug transport system ATPase component [Klebsiella pneumoniae]
MNNLCIDVKNLNKHFGEHHVALLNKSNFC